MCVLPLDQATSDASPPWVGPKPYSVLPLDQTSSQYRNTSALLIWLVAMSTHVNGPRIDMLL